MEAIIEQPVVEVEKLLIFENKEEISKIIQDAQIRGNFLNEIISAGVSAHQIKNITTSEKTIENYIFECHLQQNRAMAMEYSQGKRQNHLTEAYLLPDILENRQRLLLQWLNFPLSHKHADKYQFLKFSEGRFILDNETLQKEYVMRKLKFFVEGEQLNEYREIEFLCRFFEKIKMPNNQVKDSSYLSQRIESIGHCLYRPRWTYFNRDKH